MIKYDLTRRQFIIAATAFAAFGGASFAGCSQETTSSSEDAASAEKKTIKISCIAREEPEINWLSEQLADKYDIEAVVFSDNVSVNEALVDGSVDANYFQNSDYLENTFNAANGTDLQVYGEGIFWMPNVLMSKSFSSLDEITDGASVLIASQASGTSSELRFLEQAGLITVDPNAELATVYDVTDNPKNLEFILVEARSRTGAYDDADLMVAPSMNVVLMNRDDVNVDDALYVQTAENHSPYNDDLIITVRKETKEENPQWLQDIDAAWHSKEFAEWLIETYGENGKVPAFEY